MIQVTEAMHSGPDNRKICAAIIKRLLSQGRQPELVGETREYGQYIKVIDHSTPIYDTCFRDRRIIGFQS